ncbi:MAG TPA: hypothetical protein VFJ90_14140, partial [Candidatus Didemnitutus sp.]|nr:hypothetical protein [Candidatus Didemnitutus sp.]
PKFLVIASRLLFFDPMRLRTTSFVSIAMRRLAIGTLLLAIFCGGATGARATTSTKPDDKWRIVCIHDALSDGDIVFRLTTTDGQVQELKVPIKAGTYENDVARRVRDVFRASLSKELYHIETDDGEAVLVKKQRGKPNFLLEFVSLSVNGLGIRVELD